MALYGLKLLFCFNLVYLIVNFDFCFIPDINECLEHSGDCGQEKMCFNTRGDFTCIDIPCPENYHRDPLTK